MPKSRNRTGTACDPEILIADEPTSSLDVSVQANILNMLVGFRQTRGLALIFISHDLSVVRYITDRALVMYQGKVVEAGPTSRLLSEPSHPYTLCLVNSIPGSGKAPQLVRNGVRPERGCVFATRCSRIGEGCEDHEPRLSESVAGHRVACHYPVVLEPSNRSSNDE